MGISIIGRKYDSAAAIAQSKLSLPKYDETQRVMYQIAKPGYSYVFTVPPTTYNAEGFGADIQEVPRLYSVPIVDIKGGKSRRISFEFLIVERNKIGFGNLDNTVDQQLQKLELLADMAIPVTFDNSARIIQNSQWYIDNMSFAYQRDNTNGEITQAQCTMSLIEYTPSKAMFILLPRFPYGKFPTTGRPACKTCPEIGFNDPEWIRKLMDEELQVNKEKYQTSQGPS